MMFIAKGKLWGGLALTLAASTVVGERAAAAGDVAVPLTVEPPSAALSGPNARLLVRDNELVGRIAGGSYEVKISDDAARGRGPAGLIDVQMKRSASGYGLDGTWNGGAVHFVVQGNSLNGDAMRPDSADDRSYESCNFNVENLVGRPTTYSGRIDCSGVVQMARFELPREAASGLADQKTAVMLMAYLLAAPTP